MGHLLNNGNHPIKSEGCEPNEIKVNQRKLFSKSRSL